MILAGLVFVGTFHGNLHFRHRPTYRWIGPVVSVPMFAAWTWVFAEALVLAGRHSSHPESGDIGRLIEDMLALIFIIALMTAYAILWFSLVSPANWDEPVQKY